MIMNPRETLMSLIKQLKQNYSALMSLNLKHFNITFEQWVVLKSVGNNNITQKELAYICTKDRPTLTKILDQLENKNIIVRKVNIEDRRSFIVSVTDLGKEIIKKALPIETEIYSLSTVGIEEDNIIFLNQTLSLIITNLNKQISRGENNEQTTLE